MSPTVFREKNYRFFFFSREEKRVHIHVVSPNGEAKFWLTPNIKLAQSIGFSVHELKSLEEIITQNREMINESWRSHFGY
jgi:hypothetical protein